MVGPFMRKLNFRKDLELISKLILQRDRAKSSWSRPEVKKARRRAEARREPFLPITQIHGLCSRSQPKGVLKWVQILWVVVFALVCPAWAVRNIKVGDSLSDFSLPRADSIGGFYDSGQLAGQPTAIIFWRPNHTFSTEALRDLQTVVLEVGASRFTILAIDAKRSTTQEVQTALTEESFSFPILLDPERIMYEKVGLIVCPTTLLFDGNGILRFTIASHPRQYPQVVQARLRFLLGEIDEQTMNEQGPHYVFHHLLIQELLYRW